MISFYLSVDTVKSVEMKVIAIVFCVGFMQMLADGKSESNDDFDKYGECKYGYHDKETSSCIKNLCPPQSFGILPFCSCIKDKFEYSESFNICYRYCPDNTTGYWPNCVCTQDGAVLEKQSFKCKSCPPESSIDSVYPNCDCSAVGYFTMHDNVCNKCPSDSKGIFPNCKCDNELASFDRWSPACTTCPSDSVGIPPNCKCDDELAIFDSKTCIVCPSDSVGIPPNCECKYNGTVYSSYFNECRCSGFWTTDYPNCVCEDNSIMVNGGCQRCPQESTVGYGECKCKNDDSTYVKDKNECVACPRNSVGKYPNCTCLDERVSEDDVADIFEDILCKYCPEGSVGRYPNCICNDYSPYIQTTNICLKCPVDSTGIYPDCTCSDANGTFSAFINKCYYECPEVKLGIHPKCFCDKKDFYYDVNERVCKSIFGRKCPNDSIGIGPDCLCIRNNYKFDDYTWECVHKNRGHGGFAGCTECCPEGGNKWPQCDIPLAHKILLSLVG